MSERLDDGHPTLISFALNSAIKFWEKEVTPPGVDGGGANDTTTMHNTAFRTMAPKKLLSLTPASATVAYDPAVYDQVMAMINQNQLITVTFSDGSQVKFYGWLNRFTPGATTEGEQPTAEIEVQPSNQDASGDESTPEYITSTSAA